MRRAELKAFLDEKVALYNRPDFIANDPISIPHAYSLRQDIEIAAFFAALLAWGQRTTIINKVRTLLAHMDNAPYDFVVNHCNADLRLFKKFKHRTFNGTDCLYFIRFLSHHFRNEHSLEAAFKINEEEPDIGNTLSRFHQLFFSLDNFPMRTKKHVATPERKSACKRLAMFLRWMVRKDEGGVDFGLWSTISPAQLICPCDVHVERVARKLNLITRKTTGWLMALELTGNLRKLDRLDPVKYDFALFGLGSVEGF